MAATAAAFPAHWHLLAVAAVTAAMFGYAIGGVPAGIGVRAAVPASDSARPAGPQVWKDRRLLMIGAIVLAMALAEGAANDWLPLLMVDGHGLDAALGSLVFVGFAAAMTLGRFGGAFFLSRYSRAAVVRASAVSGAVGLCLVIFSDNAVVAAAAVLFWGLGASLGFPVALSAADSGPDETARVGLVATIGYVAFLVGPPTLGFLGDHYGLRPAMVVVLVFVAAAVLVAPAAGARGPRHGGAGAGASGEVAVERPGQRAGGERVTGARGGCSADRASQGRRPVLPLAQFPRPQGCGTAPAPFTLGVRRTAHPGARGTAQTSDWVTAPVRGRPFSSPRSCSR